MRSEVAVQMKYLAINRKESISVNGLLNEFKQACDSFLIHEDAVVQLLRKFMNGPAPPGIKAWFSLSLNDLKRPIETIKTYAEVVSHLLQCHATDEVIARAKKEIQTFKQGLKTPWDFFRKLSNLVLRCGGVHNERVLKIICQNHNSKFP